jgi:excisionase family DNA binding protein
MSFVTLQEAASYLGVSKATLRNWDKAGKLRATRHPVNDYRVYSLADLQDLHAQLPFAELEVIEQQQSMDVRATRSLIARLHNILRDRDGNSNIIERFDELMKLLFYKLRNDDEGPHDVLIRRPQENDQSYADRVRKAYSDLAAHHSAIISKSFSRLNATDAAICECASALAQVSFANVGFDVKGLAYEEVIKNTFDKNDNQQFFTPPTIVRFMVEMLSADLRGHICDPAAGTAGFLIEVLKAGVAHSSITAFEIDERLAWVDGMNLAAHGEKDPQVHWLPHGGTLGKGAEMHFGKYDAILTNPPFGSDFTDATLLPLYKLGGERPSRRRGILFLERCHQLLKVGGVLGFIIDEGVLNLPSAEDVRHFITDNFELEAIVSLPESAFMPYATVNASILFLRKLGKSKRSSWKTFFAKSERVGRKGNGDDDYVYDETGAGRLNSDLPDIVELYRVYRSSGICSDSESAYLADVRSNLASDGEGWRLDFRYHHPSREYSRALLARAKGRLIPLGDLCHERHDTLIPSSELADQMILYTGLANIESGTGIAHQVPTPANSLKSAVKRYEPGDIIFAKMRPNLRKVALINFEEGGYVSPECLVFTVKEIDGRSLVDPLLLSVLLRSDLVYGQITHLIAGIGRPRLANGDLRRVLIPSADLEAQQAWRSRYISEISLSERLKAKAGELLRDAAKMQRDAVEQLAKEFI